MFSYDLQNGQISVIGQIAGFAYAVYHTWSADYSKLAVGTIWPYVFIGEISIFNFTTGENSLITRDIYDGNKLFWVGGEDNVSLSESTSLPNKFVLHQNYPNPFNPLTRIRYYVPENSLVNIIVYDMLGNKVNHLVNEIQNSGYNSVIWDATNNQGNSVSAGIYLYSIEAKNFRQTKKMILLK